MKYYAVKRGNVTGIFEQWAECQKAVSGYSNSDYKGFNSKEEAEAYLEDRDIWNETVDEDRKNGFLVAFTDGSYDKALKRYSYGVLMITPEGKEAELCGFSTNPKYISFNNIIGEMLGVINAMDWAVANEYDKLKIYHDYEGLSKWINGEWRAESEVAKMYISIYKEKYDGLLSIVFEKVKGHSNNPYNDRVDSLAKSALHNFKRIAIEGDNWFSIPHFSKDDFETLLDLVKEVDENISIHTDNYPTKIIYRLQLGSNRLTITYFNGGDHKLLVQGKPNILFQIVVSILDELADIKCEKVLSNAYRKTIDRGMIDNAYKLRFSNFPSNYPSNVKKLIRQSLINLNYYIEAEDYAQYAFPALKALEGHIKYLISSAGGVLGQNFNQFNKDASGTYYYAGVLSNPTLAPQIAKCYNYYKAQRDTIFHFGDLMGATDSTRMIPSKADANEIINNCINLMCEL